MSNATPTRTIRYVTPTKDLVVEHRHRCLIANGYRVTESPLVVRVTYAANLPFSLIVVLVEDDTRYVDAHGWMFDDNAITKLLMRRKIRDTTDDS